MLDWFGKKTKMDVAYLAKASLWSFLGDGAATIASILLSVAFANLMSKETFGLYRYVLSVAGILTFPTLVGINMSMVQSVARGFEGSFFDGLKTKIKWGSFAALFCAVIAVYYITKANHTLAVAFIIAGCFLPFMDSVLLYQSIWAGRKNFKTQNIFQVIAQVIAVAVVFLVLLFTRNILLVILAYFAAYTFSRTLLLFITVKKAKINRQKDEKTISFGKHLSLMQVPGIIANQTDKVLLWSFLGPSALAVYSFAILLPDNIRTVFRDLETVILPKFSQKQKQELQKGLPRKILVVLPVLILAVVVYVLITPWIFKIFFPRYLDAVKYSQIYSLCIIFFTLQVPFTTALTSQLEKRKLYFFRFFAPLLQIALLAVFTPLYGIMGAIAAIISSQIIGLLVLIFLFKK